MLEGDDDHRHIRSRGCRYLQRQGRFAHARGTRQQVQPLVEAAQHVIELRHARGDAQHGAARNLPLQATRFRVRQDLRQQGAGPLQPACGRVAQRRLDVQGFFFQQGHNICSRRSLIEEGLR
jgi:hypothetical protein